jgi:hypothetical protein
VFRKTSKAQTAVYFRETGKSNPKHKYQIIPHKCIISRNPPTMNIPGSKSHGVKPSMNTLSLPSSFWVKVITLRAGFEPAREEPIGFQVQRLNHSAIAARHISFAKSSRPRGSRHARQPFKTRAVDAPLCTLFTACKNAVAS